MVDQTWDGIQIIQPRKAINQRIRILEFDVPQSNFSHLNADTSEPSKIIAKAIRQLSLRRLLIAVGIVFVFSMILLSLTALAYHNKLWPPSGFP